MPLVLADNENLSGLSINILRYFKLILLLPGYFLQSFRVARAFFCTTR